MSLGDELNALTDAAATPKGWEPYTEYAGTIGTAIVRLPSPNATKKDLLITAGFNPDEWAIKGDVNVRKWMRHDQEWLYYFKFDVTAGAETPEDVAAHVDELVAQIRNLRGRPAFIPQTADSAFLYAASDWQIGKGEGDGTAGTVDRVLQSIEMAKGRVMELRRTKRQMSTGAIAGLGDLGEGTCGFFSNQPFVTDRNRRDQNKITRELLTFAVDELRPLFDRFVVACVAGNHGENRQDGKKSTDDADNDDVAQFECIKEAFDRAGSDVEWIIPNDEMSISVDLAGVPVGFTHGHLFTGGGKMPQSKALEWWKGQDFGFQALRGAKILVSAHFHHFSSITHGARTHFQTPAMDPGSRWVTNAWGSESPAGVLTMRIDASETLGWADLQVLGKQS